MIDINKSNFDPTYKELKPCAFSPISLRTSQVAPELTSLSTLHA